MSYNRSHVPCPYEACGSSDAFSWEGNEQVGKCHSCDRSYPMAGMNNMKIFEWTPTDYPINEKKTPVTKKEY